MSWPDQKYVKFPFVKTTNIQCQNGVGTNGISIGKDAGYNTQGSGAVAIGNFAGQNTQGSGAVAIGVNAGQNTQGANSVAIGSNAGASSQAANSIVISALGTIVTGATANATYIAPIRNIYNNQLLEYNTTTNEITYQPNYFDPSGNLDLSCNLIQDVSGIFFCDGTYIGSGSSFDISTNQVLHISSSQNVLIDASSSVIINRKLGVGTATPAYNLVVSDNTNSLTKLGIQTTSGTIGNFAGIGFGTSGVATNLKSAIGHLCTGASNGIGALIFANNSVTDASPATPSDEKMRITNDGNVGIGTTTPSSTLEVRKNALGYAGVFYNTSATGEGLAIRGGNTSSQNSLVVQNYDGNNPILIARSDGNVGIGTSSPAFQLQVGISGAQMSLGGAPISNGTGRFKFLNSNSVKNWQISTNDTIAGAFEIIPSTVNGGTSFTTPAMLITSTGNVGIGTTTPETKLDVVGNSIQCSNQGRFKGWYSGSQGSGLATEIGILSGEGYINTYDRTAGVYGNLNLIAGTANMKLTTSGNVGIGTTTPTEKLNISGGNLLMGGTFDGMLMNPGSGAGSLAITRSGNFINNVQQISGTYTDNVGGSSGGGAQVTLLKNEMSFSTYPNTGTLGAPVVLTERMRITSTGVGINTTTPNYKLQVEGSGTANEIVGWFNNQGAFSSSIAVTTASKTAYITNHQGLSTPNYTGQLSSALAFGVGSGVAPIQFWNGSPATAKMTLLENGNVGIGTSSPAYPLDVVGSAKMTTIRDTANSVGTAGQVLSSTGSALSWITPSAPAVQMAILNESKAAGTNSSVTFADNARTSREINTIQFNNLGITLSLISPDWTIFIPTAGTYFFRATAVYGAVRTGANPFAIKSKIFLKNETLGLDDWIVGQNSQWLCFDNVTVAGFPFNFQAECSGVQTISGPTVISFRQVCNNQISAGNKNGGRAVNLPSAAGVPEIYATLEITKIG